MAVIVAITIRTIVVTIVVITIRKLSIKCDIFQGKFFDFL